MRRAYRERSSAVARQPAGLVENSRHTFVEPTAQTSRELVASRAPASSSRWDDLAPIARELDTSLLPPLQRELYGLLDASDAIFLIDGQGQILFRNQVAASLVDDAAGLRPPSLLHCEGEVWRCALELLSQGLKGGQPIERSVTTQQPAKCWRLCLQELQNSVAGAQRFALRFQDMTEHSRLQEALKMSRSMARSGLLLAGAAHQAKNVVFGLSATVQAMQAAHSADLNRRDPHVANLKEGIARLDAMVRNVFAQSRPRGQCAMLWASVLASEAIRGCTQLAISRGVNICIGVTADARVWGEPQPLIQAMENFIDNAVRFSQAGSTITVDVGIPACADGRVSIRIADRGPGFRNQDMDKLFTPFFTGRPGGTGLGMAVARHIIEEHGGKVVLANSDAGGAVVTVLLPSAQSSAEPHPSAEAC